LLQSTSSDFPHGLGNTDGVLGRFLHDHPIAKLKVDVTSPTSARPAAYLTRAALSRSEPLYAAAACQWTGPRVLAKLLKSRLLGHPPEVGFNVFGAMAPVAEGCVTLDDSVRSLDGSPSLAIHIRHPPESSALLESSRQQILDLLERGGMRPKQRFWAVERAGSSIHFGGTCRMHARPRFGMLDGWGRMHAVRNVVVADSAAFTTGPEKNPALTAMALAARASDKLVRDLRAREI
jgi:choline dehydrogenase-like flavoprotein